jgi:serine/threonine-protein kinase
VPDTLIADRYVVLRRLGTGGMGTVLLARDEVLRREVAIKRVHASGGSDAALRIRREAKLGAGLNHPALVTIFDTVLEGDELLIVMEHVAGETLGERMARGRMSVDEVLAVLRPVADGLDHAHAHGIVHRDVKPDNILLGERGVVKLTDLGVAVAEDVTQITRDDAIVGSLPYMAPEQFEPGRPTAAADIYALAAVAFQALTGRRVRTGKTPLEVARAATQDPPPDLRALAPDLPAPAAAVLSAALSREPERRPVTARVFLRELELALAPPEPEAEAHRPRQQPATVPLSASAPSGRRRGTAVGVAVALLATAGVVALVLAGGDEGTPRHAAQRPAQTPARSPAQSAAKATPAAGASNAAPVAADPSTPAGAVRAFYKRAARDDFAGAWALAGDGMRAAFGNDEARLAADLGSLESIRFTTLAEEATTAAGTRVRVATVARHTDRTDRCSGALLAVPDGTGGFRVDPAGLSCRSS